MLAIARRNGVICRSKARLRKAIVKVEPRLTRVQAAVWITEQTGVPLNPRTLEKMAVPYCLIFGKAMYSLADLQDLADDAFGAAGRRMGGRGRRTATAA